MSEKGSNLSKRVVFDHDRGTMFRFATGHSFVTIPVGQREDELACCWLLDECHSWTIAFLHIDELQWKKLVDGAPKGKVLVRFSTSGYHPAELEKSEALCLRCLKKTTKLSSSDIGTLVAVLNDSTDILRKRQVPSGLADLISFREPHRLRSLETLLGAVMAAWSLGHKGADERKKAKEALCLDMTPPVPPDGFTERSSLWRHLGFSQDATKVDSYVIKMTDELSLELGVKDLLDDPKLGRPLTDLLVSLSQKPYDEEVDFAVAVRSFNALRRYLKSR